MTFESVAEFYADLVRQAQLVGQGYAVAIACGESVGAEAFVLVSSSAQPIMIESAFSRVTTRISIQTRLNAAETIAMVGFLASMRERYGL